LERGGGKWREWGGGHFILNKRKGLVFTKNPHPRAPLFVAIRKKKSGKDKLLGDKAITRKRGKS